MDIVSKVFGNEQRVKLLRFLILNDKKSFTFSDLEKKIGLPQRVVKREGEALRKIGLAKIVKMVPLGFLKGKRRIQTKGKIPMILINHTFPYLPVFKNLFIATNSLTHGQIIKRLNPAGKMKLIVASGLFIESSDSRLDLLVVGDKLDKQAIERTMHSFESILGRELRYAMFETQDFNYRVNIFDRLIRDVLDYPHQKILNKLGL
mgnify:CR=1 FL=1